MSAYAATETGYTRTHSDQRTKSRTLHIDYIFVMENNHARVCIRHSKQWQFACMETMKPKTARKMKFVMICTSGCVLRTPNIVITKMNDTVLPVRCTLPLLLRPLYTVGTCNDIFVPDWLDGMEYKFAKISVWYMTHLPVSTHFF